MRVVGAARSLPPKKNSYRQGCACREGEVADEWEKLPLFTHHQQYNSCNNTNDNSNSD